MKMVRLFLFPLLIRTAAVASPPKSKFGLDLKGGDKGGIRGRDSPPDEAPGEPAEEREEEEDEEEGDDCRALVVGPACHGQVFPLVIVGTCCELYLSLHGSDVGRERRRWQAYGEKDLLSGCIMPRAKVNRKWRESRDSFFWLLGNPESLTLFAQWS